MPIPDAYDGTLALTLSRGLHVVAVVLSKLALLTRSGSWSLVLHVHWWMARGPRHDLIYPARSFQEQTLGCWRAPSFLGTGCATYLGGC